jgi:formate dehydrogenase assembly factor FdhD
MEVLSYSASACGCLVLWLRLAGRLVTVDELAGRLVTVDELVGRLVAVDELVGRFVTAGFRVATVFCAGAFLGVAGVGAGSIAVSLSCTTVTSDPSVTSLVTTLASECVVSSATGVCGSTLVKVEASASGEACWFPSE